MQVSIQRIHCDGAAPEKEIKVLEGCTVAQAAAKAGYSTDGGFWYYVNGSGALLSQVLLPGDVVVMTPELQGG